MGCTKSKQGSVDINPDKSAPISPNTGCHVIVTSSSDYYEKHPGTGSTPTTSRTRPPEPSPAPKPNTGKTEEEKKVLKVVGIDLKVAENTRNHRTDCYEVCRRRLEGDAEKVDGQQLVVRRGEHLELDVTFDRTFDDVRDDFRLVFDVGDAGRESRGTRAVVALQAADDDKPRRWSANVVRQSAETVTIRVYVAPCLPVGKWSIKVDTVVKKAEHKVKVFRYVHPDPIYVLFNPWCPDDQVFLNDDPSRVEYVLNDSGVILRGTGKQIGFRPWSYGQFEACVLDVSFHLLDVSGLSWRHRGDPVHVVRKLASAINSASDKGLLVGNWSGEYNDGTSPHAWTGSFAILDEFWRTREPVKYTQCWVTSAVFTTVCRALGLPTRCVTGFATPCGTDGSPAVDLYWSAADGKPIANYNVDAIWSFRVWNDVWMARPDLPSGFGGWQIVDCTPQQTSEGVCCTGPTSVEAVKNGLVQLPYDGSVAFAQFNSKIVNWIRQPDDNWIHSVQRNCTGKNISTKSLHGNDRHDITSLYKFAEGSHQEDMAVWRTCPEYITDKHLHVVDVTDMEFTLVADVNSMQLGSAFDVTLRVQSCSATDRTITVTTTLTPIQYTGFPGKTIKGQQSVIHVPPLGASEATTHIKYEDYQDHASESCYFMVNVMCVVNETQEYHCKTEHITLEKPSITVKAPNQVNLGDDFELEASFVNPLPRPLTRCEFRVEAARFQRPITFKHETVPPHGECKLATSLKATTGGGDVELLVGFESKELKDVTGTSLLRVLS